MAKWYNKASVQTAIVSGAFLLVLSLIGGMFSLYQQNLKLSIELGEKINGAIFNFSKNVNASSKKTSSINLTPDFDSFDSVISTMRHLNSEAGIYDATVDLAEIHRYIKRYGTQVAKNEFARRLNDYAASHQAVNDYLLNLLKGGPGPGSVSEYTRLLNLRSGARNSFQTFVINLEDEDFRI